MSSIVIVALPEDNEPVWKLSSEKKPHMTLLYMNAPLGVDEEAIIRYVEHAADTSLRRFGLSVDRRGTLGENDADVLFFDSDFAYEIRKFRSLLLKNDSIAENYVKADQFPGWIPHLTMGFPETPAKESEDQYGLQWVNFDKIAIWTSDYDGPEFELKGYDRAIGVDEASWSEDHGVYIMHFGVKGMRWGVRRPTDSSGLVKGTVAKAIAKGQTPDTAKSSGGSSGKSSRSGGKGADHKTMVKNLKKDVEDLSTNEIREITARIKAVNDFKATTAAQKEAKASVGKKIAKWALGQVVAGAKKKGESYIQELVGDGLEGVFPKTPSANKRDTKEKQAKEDRDRRIKKEDEQTAEKAKKEREAAVSDLTKAVKEEAGTYNITNLPEKKGG